MAGRPKGSPNKDKPYKDALRRAIARAEESGGIDAHTLDKIAEKHLAEAFKGDMQAIKELADRLDGKPAQAITDADGGPIQVMVVKFDAES